MRNALLRIAAALASLVPVVVAQNKTLVRLGYFSESMPFAVACARHWLDTDDYEVGCYPQSSGSYAVSRLDQGDLDVSLLGSTPAAISISRGVRATTFQMAQGHGSSQGLAVREKHGPLEMLGECLASPFGSTAHYHLLFLLDMLHLRICPHQSSTCPIERDFSCVTLVNMSPAGLMAAWDAETIDGAYIWGEGFLHMKATGGTVIVDSGDLTSWGKETFIVVAAREHFSTNYPGLLEHITRVKSLLDDSWLAAEAAWDASLDGNATFLASISHFLSSSRPRELRSTMEWRSNLHKDMASKDIYSTQTQLGCHYLAHPEACVLSETRPVSGLAQAIVATAAFFMEQKGLATVVPQGKHHAPVAQATFFDTMIDPSPLFTASGMHSVTLETIADTGTTSTPRSTGSIETGRCDAVPPAQPLFHSPGNAITGSFTDKPATPIGVVEASYENNMNCFFLIPAVTDDANLVEVTFTSLRVWSGDLVRLYEGSAVNDDTLLAQLQGIDPQIPPIRSVGPILVHFVTDSNTEECYNLPEGDGWELSFNRSHPGCFGTGAASCSNHGRCIQKPLLGHPRSVCECDPGWTGADCSLSGCMGTTISTTPTGTFRSASESLESTHRYENMASCLFEVHTDETTVIFNIEVDLEDTFDWLDVRAGTSSDAEVLSRLTGHTIRTVVAPTINGVASLYYTTDDKGRRSGFTADYTTRSPTCAAQCSAAFGQCEDSTAQATCICKPGWSGVDCSTPVCSPRPLRYPGKTSGVIQSNADSVSIPAMTDCHFETAALPANMYVGTRLRINTFDLEPASVGDRVAISYDATVVELRNEACSSSVACSQPWQTGECIDEVCVVRAYIDVRTTTPLDVHIQTDRNDATAGGFRKGVSMGWEAIAVCPEQGEADDECLGDPGSCDCELSGGRVDIVPGACVCPGGHCDCGVGGVIIKPSYWTHALFGGILICFISGVLLKRKYSKRKSARRRIDAANKADKKMEEALKAQAASMELEKQNMSYPEEWELDPSNVVELDDDTEPNGKRQVHLPKDGLVQVHENEAEFWEVYEKLTSPPNPDFARVDPKTRITSDTRGMHDAWITELHRIQNPDLYTYFQSQKNRLEKSSGPVPRQGGPAPKAPNAFTEDGQIKQVLGWHGTGQFDCSNIYNDRQDGFMMQFASQGQWGRGLYFADEAGYSHNYATKASTLQDGGASKGMQYDECEMLLVSLLSGNTIEMDRDECDDQTMRETCHELKTPPTVDGCISAGVTQTKDGVDRCTRTPRPNVGNFKYNTVRGYTQTDQRQGDGSWIKDAACPRSKIWIVYENGRAYPRYRVRYYRGAFDPGRGGIRRFRSRQEAGIPPGTNDVLSRQCTGTKQPPGTIATIDRQPRQPKFAVGSPPSQQPPRGTHFPPPSQQPPRGTHFPPPSQQPAQRPLLPRQQPAVLPPRLPIGFCHVGPDGQRNPYTAHDNKLISDARNREVRFGLNAVSRKMVRSPPSQMIQVNLSNENTRVVESANSRP